jgi:hypothetical protein
MTSYGQTDTTSAVSLLLAAGWEYGRSLIRMRIGRETIVSPSLLDVEGSPTACNPDVKAKLNSHHSWEAYGTVLDLVKREPAT